MSEILTRAQKHALKAGRVEMVGSHRGEPGGPNKDQIRLHMSTGKVVVIDAYSGGDIEVCVEDAEERRW